MKAPPERLGSFYLGAEYDLKKKEVSAQINYDARDLTTHGICVGMTGSGKTGLCIGLLEEAAIDQVPAILVDPKGDITNLLLQFPELRSEDFLPWVNSDDARRKGMTIKEYSSYISGLWRKGLGKWGIDPERIRMLTKSAEFTVYTPGSDAGLPVNILKSFAAPEASFDSEAEAIRDRINGTVAAVLSLSNIDVDSVRSREAILLSTIFEYYWSRNEDLNLEKLILAVQNPPVRKLGVFDVDSFYPEKERFELAVALNSLVASPSFKSWMQGESLDIDRLLYTEKGKPRHSIFYIAHLSDRERMFFVTLLLEHLLMWMRSQTGTTSLRALLYFDEVFGFFPPVQEPPSKRPLMTLLKQARAFGLGVLLVTQNPVDIDYKGLTNAGTWFIGKLQAERDKNRVLQGLKGAITAAGGNTEKTDYDGIINSLGSRIFLMHNVHESEPRVFHTRWVMSYLRGPLTRPQVRKLMDNRKRQMMEAETFATQPVEPAFSSGKMFRAGIMESEDYSNTPPVLTHSITQVFIPPMVDGKDVETQLTMKAGREASIESTRLVYQPAVLGGAITHFVDRKKKIDWKVEKVNIVFPKKDMVGIAWEDAETLSISLRDLDSVANQHGYEKEPFYHKVPEQLADAKKFKRIGKNYADWVYYNSKLVLRVQPDLKIVKHPEENERDFLIRIQQTARENRDTEVDKLEKKYQKQLTRLGKKLSKRERELTAHEQEYKARQREEMIGAGESVLSLFLGRRRTRDATTIARRRRLTSKVKTRIGETTEEISELKKEIKDLEEELEKAAADIKNRWDQAQENIGTEELKPRRNGIDVRLIALSWVPYWHIKYHDGRISRETTFPAHQPSKQNQASYSLGLFERQR